MIDVARLVAPREHLSVLIEPPPHRTLALASAQASLPVITLAQRGLPELRGDLRRSLRLAGPLIVTGHQAEFFHAGVFAKIVAAHALATRVGGSCLFLLVDSDTPKTSALAVPQRTAAGPRRIDVAIPALQPQWPIETQPAVAHQHWLDFFSRVAGLMNDYERSLLRSFAAGWLLSRRDDARWSERFAGGLSHAAQAAGSETALRVLSELCRTDAYACFFLEIAQRAAEFAGCYNAAQADYRRRFRERSLLRPVPPLQVASERVELPFWLLTTTGPRERAFVHREPGGISLFAGARPVARLPEAGPLDVHEFEATLGGWRVRPRALMLSCFARLVVADLFIHGIGGGRYDQMTEQIAREFFDLELPPLACVTATMLLPLDSGASGDVAAARRRARDIRYNPQRHADGLPDDLLAARAALIARSEELRRAALGRRAAAERRAVYAQIRAVNEQLIARSGAKVAALDQAAEQAEFAARLQRVARDREYFFALHSVDAMHALRGRIDAALQPRRPE